MTLLKTVVWSIIFSVICSLSYAQDKGISVKAKPTITCDAAYYQEWYSGHSLGVNGFNVIFPKVTLNGDVELKDVYFKGLKAPLQQTKGQFVATLEKPSKLFTIQKSNKPNNYKFKLRDNECVISYVKDGEKHFMKITINDQRAAAFYKKGPPSRYGDTGSSSLVSVDNSE